MRRTGYNKAATKEEIDICLNCELPDCWEDSPYCRLSILEVRAGRKTKAERARRYYQKLRTDPEKFKKIYKIGEKMHGHAG